MSQPKITSNMSPMMRAFIQQADLDDEKTFQKEASIANFQNEQYEKAKNQLAQSGDIIQHLLDSQTTGVNNKSEIHPQFRNYDHSLEGDRVELSGAKRSPGKPNLDPNRNDYRPVERDGVIEMEPVVTIEELLKRT